MNQPMFITFAEFYVGLSIAFALGYMVANRGWVYEWLMAFADRVLGGPSEEEYDPKERLACMQRHPAGQARMMRLVDGESQPPRGTGVYAPWDWEPDDPADPYR